MSPDRTTGHYNDLETLSIEERRERQWKDIKALVDNAAAHSNEFKDRLGRAGMVAGDIRTPEDFATIPPLRKRHIIELQKKHGLEWMLTKPVGALRRIYQSPGPIFDPEGNAPDYWGWAEAFFSCGFRPEDLVQATFGYHLTPAGLMMEEPLREIGCCVLPTGPGNTATQIDFLTGLPVTGFVGMASYLSVIGDKAIAAGLDLEKDFSLEVAFVAAERLTDELRSGVENKFGMLVRQGYGTADVGCIAYECAHLGGMHISTRRWVEICDPDTGLPLPDGEMGEVVVTPFFDEYPLIRLATGDLSMVVNGACDCGRTAPKLAGILGRVDDTAKVKGQFIYPSQASTVMAKFDTIQRWQIRITNPGGRDTLTVVLQMAPGATLDEKAFTNEFVAVLKLRPAITVLPAGELVGEDAPPLVDDRTFE